MTALGIQLTSHGFGAWITGYVGLAALAVVLVLKNQMDEIF
jgi:hypothetical protein